MRRLEACRDRQGREGCLHPRDRDAARAPSRGRNAGRPPCHRTAAETRRGWAPLVAATPIGSWQTRCLHRPRRRRSPLPRCPNRRPQCASRHPGPASASIRSLGVAAANHPHRCLDHHPRRRPNGGAARGEMSAWPLRLSAEPRAHDQILAAPSLSAAALAPSVPSARPRAAATAGCAAARRPRSRCLR
eukprot:1597950-Pleurochrysis_carterae.AAC.1